MSINRGDIFYVNPSETVGSEQRSGRPAIIVSNPLCNEHSPVVEVVYLTCQYKKPTHSSSSSRTFQIRTNKIRR
mgnify:CR=1 FL=1